METIINDTQLAELLHTYCDASLVGMDTEFIRENTYYPILCLIQLSFEDGKIYLIDSLAPNIDLTPLWKFFQHRTIIFHAGGQDIEIMYATSYSFPLNIFDTQLAAMVLNYGNQLSYQATVKLILNIDIEKELRLADWTIRPLIDSQIAYAKNDVRHLIPMYHYLQNKLDSSHRTPILVEKTAQMKQRITEQLNPEKAWKSIKLNRFNGYQQAIIKKIFTWREEIAQKSNVPKNRILKNRKILSFSAILPTQYDFKSIINRHFTTVKDVQKLLTELNEIKENESLYVLPTKNNPINLTKKENDQLLLLKFLLTLSAKEQNINSKLIANSDELLHFVKNPESSSLLSSWKKEVFGNLATKVIKEGVTITYSPEEGIVIST